jgi:23S rRNA (adenine2030-N6)-methyltransferase
MNYRHHFHAGNFADVMKHMLLTQLVRAMQRKEKGFLYLDTHAGRGRYDLTAAAAGDTQARTPEWPNGIGRLWSAKSDESTPTSVREYLSLVRELDRRWGNLEAGPRFYPGSPWIVRQLARPIDRLALCEKHPAEVAALRTEFDRAPRVSVHEADGYVALRAMLPPPERRALVLIDPPFEAQDEFAQIATALREGLQRFPSGVFAVWYPLTGRARVQEFFAAVQQLRPPPTLAAELAIAGENSLIKMRGCGVLVINPPWQFETEIARGLQHLADVLAQEPGADANVSWVVRET